MHQIQIFQTHNDSSLRIIKFLAYFKINQMDRIIQCFVISNVHIFSIFWAAKQIKNIITYVCCICKSKLSWHVFKLNFRYGRHGDPDHTHKPATEEELKLSMKEIAAQLISDPLAAKGIIKIFGSDLSCKIILQVGLGI